MGNNCVFGNKKSKDESSYEADTNLISNMFIGMKYCSDKISHIMNEENPKNYKITTKNKTIHARSIDLYKLKSNIYTKNQSLVDCVDDDTITEVPKSSHIKGTIKDWGKKYSSWTIQDGNLDYITNGIEDIFRTVSLIKGTMDEELGAPPIELLSHHVYLASCLLKCDDNRKLYCELTKCEFRCYKNNTSYNILLVIFHSEIEMGRQVFNSKTQQYQLEKLIKPNFWPIETSRETIRNCRRLQRALSQC